MANKTGTGGFERVVRRLVKQSINAADPSPASDLFPSHIHIEPTNVCNLRCVHCHHHLDETGKSAFTRKQGLMDFSLYEKVLGEIGPLGCAITLDVQGEPLLHPDILAMVELAKSYGLYVSIITNATRLDEELALEFLALRLDRVVFSFDAVEKTIYESIRVKSRFEPTLRAILGFLRHNEDAGHPAHVCMSMVHQARNDKHVEAYKAYFEKLPVDKVFINPMLNLCGEAGTSGEIDLRTVQAPRRENWPICRIPWEDLTVNWDGLVTACPVDVCVKFPIGDAREASLKEIWNGPAMRTFRTAHLQREYGPIEGGGALCSRCNCLFDPEYDLRRFPEYAVKAITRQALHYARELTGEGERDCARGADDAAAKFLDEEIRRVNGLLQGLDRAPQARKPQ